MPHAWESFEGTTICLFSPAGHGIETTQSHVHIYDYAGMPMIHVYEQGFFLLKKETAKTSLSTLSELENCCFFVFVF